MQQARTLAKAVARFRLRFCSNDWKPKETVFFPVKAVEAATLVWRTLCSAMLRDRSRQVPPAWRGDPGPTVSLQAVWIQDTKFELCAEQIFLSGNVEVASCTSDAEHASHCRTEESHYSPQSVVPRAIKCSSGIETCTGQNWVRSGKDTQNLQTQLKRKDDKTS